MKGFSFLELLIATVIVSIIIIGLFAGFNAAGKCARHNANRTMALCFAQGMVEEIKDMGYTDLDGYNGYNDAVPLYQIEGINIEAERTVEVTTAGPHKIIAVNVSWNSQSGNGSEEINTIISEHD